MAALFARVNSVVLGSGLLVSGVSKLAGPETEVKPLSALRLPFWTLEPIASWQAATGGLLLLGGVYSR